MATPIRNQLSGYFAANEKQTVPPTDLLDLSSSLDCNVPVLARKLKRQLLGAQGSDLHLTPDDGKHHVYLRRNGALELLVSIHEKIGKELINHWKVLANLDLTLTTKPQDGSILNSKTGHDSYRVSTCPTLFGEKLVIRLHPSSVSAISIHQLGMTQKQRTLYLQSIQSHDGLVLVSGPTGSGKTNTLYAALSHLKKQPLNIVSIEDPIEVNIPGITQINVNASFGFPDALRTVLRQDPDVIMIGEIRDQETAEMALSAAQTGHLVLASIHAADSYSALLRLQDLGINLRQAIPQLKLILSQRLVRTTSNSLTSTRQNSRYHSRRGVFDLLPCSSALQTQLLTANDEKQLRQTIESCIHEIGDTSDSILLQLIQSHQTDWTEIQRVYGWEKVAKLSAQSTPISVW